MRRSSRVLVVALLAGVASLSVPEQALAQTAPRARDATVSLAGVVLPGQTIGQTVPLEWRANMAGISLASADRAAEGIEIAIRAHDVDTGWAEWKVLRIEDEEAPDGAEARKASRRVFTQPYWVGTADRIDVTVTSGGDALPARDVRLHLQNTAGDARPLTVFARAARVMRAVLFAQPRAAEAATTKPSIITRAQWHADERLRECCPRYADGVRAVFVHHSDNSNSYSRSEGPALVRGIYRYHTRTRGYSDIGYNFLIDRYGRIYEGRFGGMDKPVIGAHTLGFNTRSTGVAFIGNFTDVVPPSAMTGAASRLLAWKMDLHHIPPNGRVAMTSAGNERYDEGDTVYFNRISGHRDAKPTACPGTYLYRRLSTMRARVDAVGHPKIYVPVISSGILRPDGDSRYETVAFSATFSRSVVWTVEIRDRAGTVAKTFTGTGTSMTSTQTRWGGLGTNGLLVPNGRYTWKMTATYQGASATPATGTVYVATSHPAGSILSDASGRYLLDGAPAQARPFPADGDIVYRSNLGTQSPVVTGPSERARAVVGATPVALRDGTLFRNDADASRYIWSNGALRRFVADSTNADTFTVLGYNSDATIAASQDYLNALAQGAPVNDATVHPAGSVVRDAADNSYWVISVSGRAPIGYLAVVSRYRLNEIVEMTAGDRALSVSPAAIAVREGALLEGPDRARYIVTGGAKRKFYTTTMFNVMGYPVAALIRATATELDAIPNGEIIG